MCPGDASRGSRVSISSAHRTPLHLTLEPLHTITLCVRSDLYVHTHLILIHTSLRAQQRGTHIVYTRGDCTPAAGTARPDRADESGRTKAAVPPPVLGCAIVVQCAWAGCTSRSGAPADAGACCCRCHSRVGSFPGTPVKGVHRALFPAPRLDEHACTCACAHASTREPACEQRQPRATAHAWGHAGPSLLYAIPHLMVPAPTDHEPTPSTAISTRNP